MPMTDRNEPGPPETTPAGPSIDRRAHNGQYSSSSKSSSSSYRRDRRFRDFFTGCCLRITMTTAAIPTAKRSSTPIVMPITFNVVLRAEPDDFGCDGGTYTPLSPTGNGSPTAGGAGMLGGPPTRGGFSNAPGGPIGGGGVTGGGAIPGPPGRRPGPSTISAPPSLAPHPGQIRIGGGVGPVPRCRPQPEQLQS